MADQPKLVLHLLPCDSLAEVAHAMDSKHDGTDYEPGDWRERKSYEDHIKAALRHLYAEFDGEARAPDTGHRHIAHAAARLLMALDPCYQKGEGS